MHVSGHADCMNDGRDLVCAAVSTLVGTLAQVVDDAKGDSELAKSATDSISSGNADIICTAVSDTAFTILITQYHVICRGFALLAANHPENVGMPSTKIDG